MGYIIDPSNDEVWVAIKPQLKKEDLVKRILSSDIMVSDLDDTDTQSPSKEIAYASLKRPKYLSDPRFWLWCISTEYKLIKNGKNAESETWATFIEKFLRNPKELEKLKQKYTPEFVASKFYQGAMDFYGLMPLNMIKIYLTRNIKEVAESYKQSASFDEVMAEQFDKENSIKRISQKYPERRKFIVKGDSPEDEQMLKVLIHEKQRGKLDQVTSIYVADSQNHINPNFDVNIGRNYKGLVELLQTY